VEGLREGYLDRQAVEGFANTALPVAGGEGAAGKVWGVRG